MYRAPVCTVTKYLGKLDRQDSWTVYSSLILDYLLSLHSGFQCGMLRATESLAEQVPPPAVGNNVHLSERCIRPRANGAIITK